jgi:hypothetical protein
LILTPSIPEYLTGSSAVNAIFLNPILFLFGIVANLGLYGPGVLLIREAKVRWDKGWATVLLLGAAYGILEEGIALSTLFNPLAGPVGQLGFFGHWLGVNWVWVAGIVPVHMIFSISLPILLVGLALPETRGVSFLKSDRSLSWAIGILFVDVFALFFFLILLGEHFWMGWPVFALSLASIGALIYLGRKAPTVALTPKTDTPTRRPFVFGILGAVFYPTVLLAEFIGIGKLPAYIVTPLVVLLQAGYLFYILRAIGRTNNERNLIALAAGLVIPLAVFGIVSQISLPLVILVDVALIAFFTRLWRMYPKQVSVTPLLENSAVV